MTNSKSTTVGARTSLAESLWQARRDPDQQDIDVATAWVEALPLPRVASVPFPATFWTIGQTARFLGVADSDVEALREIACRLCFDAEDRKPVYVDDVLDLVGVRRPRLWDTADTYEQRCEAVGTYPDGGFLHSLMCAEEGAKPA